MHPRVLESPCYFPVVSAQNLQGPECEGQLEDQIEMFSFLALNKELSQEECCLIQLDKFMEMEATFYTCRAVRRLLLGVVYVPCFCASLNSHQLKLITGPNFRGEGLLISDAAYCTAKDLDTCTYIPGVLTAEETDNVLEACYHKQRMIYFPKLLTTKISWSCMLQLASRYIDMYDLDECFSLFYKRLDPLLQQVCTYNYSMLTWHLKQPSCQKWPLCYSVPTRSSEIFSLLTFMNTWPQNSSLAQLKRSIVSNIHKCPKVLFYLFKTKETMPITVTSKNILQHEDCLLFMFPQWAPRQLKKQPPDNKLHLVCVAERGTASIWLQFSQPAYMLKIALCMSVAEHVVYEAKNFSHTENVVSLPRALVANFDRMKYAPRDFPVNYDFYQKLCLEPQHKEDRMLHLKDSFTPLSHISIHGFKVNVFNTNMVINTSIRCLKHAGCYKQFTNIPKLVNNFVIRKYSVKEPAFTVSIFYSGDFSIKAAINVNISGDLVNFVFAMNTLKCLLPIVDIFPASVANWNSTFDLHGLENQQLVRDGRKDVFWTTNFPSAVSSSKGYNVSWFKAATATVSKIYGDHLIQQVKQESALILGHRNARIDSLKNKIYSTLEHRNGAQIQAAHKKFLECLYECCSWARLSPSSILGLGKRGMFDFSKRMIAHSKNKHECALSGYKVCNLIPKVLVNNKKVRLDECGRNANFLSCIQKINPKMINTKVRILKHILRRASLRSAHLSHWKLSSLLNKQNRNGQRAKD
ncbi:ORF24 [Bovine gammaherpesvirus 6]|uniref:ORF24 n=1 Tax=Bovine gammaherpesvirus 6 TaxID=1504288 RepID=A0A060D2Z9_9GAMA|nr:ORF24 [Bovine gammaherpesvirus 6]AIB03179.1 ORF24 [Bovine gammaherpesvirus 6]